MDEVITFILELIFFLGIPIGIIVFFIMSLVRYRRTPKDDPLRKERRFSFIVSAVLMGLLIVSVGLLILLFTLAMNHM